MKTLEDLLPSPRAGNPGSRPNKKGGKILAEEIKKSTSSRVAFRASPSVKPDEGRERRTTAISGERCFELYKSSNRDGSLLKMCVGYLLSSEAWYSNKCWLTWKAQGTKFRRLLFLLSPKTRHTEGTECGLLPTVQASDQYNANTKNGHDMEKGYLRDINGYVQRAMLPTAQARDYKGRCRRSNRGIEDDLPHKIEGNTNRGTQTGLKLQPSFVEWMMGFPLNWTDLNCPKPDTEWNALKHLGTPSCHR